MSTKDGLGGTDGGEKVLPLFPDRPSAAGTPGSQQVVEYLEKLLKQARAGHISSCSVVAFTVSDDIISGTYGTGHYSAMVGALEDLQQRIIQNQWLAQGRGPAR